MKCSTSGGGCIPGVHLPAFLDEVFSGFNFVSEADKASCNAFVSAYCINQVYTNELL
jgi:hypothetical protein